MLLFACCIPVSAALDSNGSLTKADSSVLEALKHIDISLLTCQPHDEVYSLYGHTAIRIKNSLTGQDVAVNYGVFDTRVSYFVLRFIFGLTDYSMGTYSYQDFLSEYRYFGSGVYEQHINMSVEEKMAFLNAIIENSKPENVVYRYNYFYDNCTTRARDIILGAFSGSVTYKPLTHLQRGKMSFRELIHLKNENHRWARVGNDLLLGYKADQNTTHEERQFLPEVLACDFDSAQVVYENGIKKVLVDSAYWALQPGTPWHSPDAIDFPLTPTECAWAVFCVILALVLAECLWLKKSLPWVHYFIYCCYAVPGMILTLMIFSQHPTVNVNLQMLILCPLWFVFGYPTVFGKWGRRVMLSCLVLFFIGNFIQDYAEGANVLALALLTTFCPYYFVNSKKNSNFAKSFNKR